MEAVKNYRRGPTFGSDENPFSEKEYDRRQAWVRRQAKKGIKTTIFACPERQAPERPLSEVEHTYLGPCQRCRSYLWNIDDNLNRYCMKCADLKISERERKISNELRKLERKKRAEEYKKRLERE